MSLILSQIYTFYPEHSPPIRCNINLVGRDRLGLCLLGERVDNRGASITNSAEGLVSSIYNTLIHNIVRPIDIIWLEWYPYTHSPEDSFSIDTFTWTCFIEHGVAPSLPVWKASSAEFHPCPADYAKNLLQVLGGPDGFNSGNSGYGFQTSNNPAGRIYFPNS
jgi:hypothetical protein